MTRMIGGRPLNAPNVDIEALQAQFHAFVKMKPGAERQKAMLAWLAGSHLPGACNKIPVNGKFQLSTRDPDLSALLAKGKICFETLSVKSGKHARFCTKGQVFVKAVAK